MFYRIKILDSVCREVCTERHEFGVVAFDRAAKLAKFFKRVYVVSPRGQMTIWADGQRVQLSEIYQPKPLTKDNTCKHVTSPQLQTPRLSLTWKNQPKRSPMLAASSLV
jgi:hypothetical protein